MKLKFFVIIYFLSTLTSCNTYSHKDWREFHDKTVFTLQELAKVKSETEFKLKVVELKKTNLFKMDSGEEIILQINSKNDILQSLKDFNNSIYAYSRLKWGAIICYTDGHIEYSQNPKTFETIISQGKGSLQEYDYKN